jgi:hypothetical protein
VLLLKQLQQRHIDVISLRLAKSLYSRSVLFKRTNTFDSVFFRSFAQYSLQDQIPDIRQLSFFFRFSFMAPKTFLLFVTVAMLSLYRTSLNCSGRRAEKNIKHSYRYCSHLPGPEFMYPPKYVEFLVSQARGILNSQIAFFLANDIGTDDWE